MSSAYATPFSWLFSTEIIGSGTDRQESRDLASFIALTANIPVVIEIKSGSGRRMSISGDDNILPVIDTTVKDGRLWITAPKKKIKPSKPLVITLEARGLQALSLENGASVSGTNFPSSGLDASISGGGNLKIDLLDLDHINLSIAGGGSFSANGKVNSFSLSVVGRGTIEAGRLEAKQVNASVTGYGDVVVWVANGMNVQTIGPGTVKYYGDAAVSGKAQRLGGRPAP